jgi:hypothetical protein
MPETKLLPTPSEFLRDHLVWVLGIAPFVAAAFNVMIISTGDLEVFAYLLQNLSLVSLVLGVTLPLIPPAIVLISLVWLSQRTAIPRDERTKLRSYFWQPRALIMVAVGLAMQMIWIFFTGSLIIIYYLTQQLGRYWYGRRRSSGNAEAGLDCCRKISQTPNFATLRIMHRAPALDSGAESHIGKGMSHRLSGVRFQCGRL